MRWHLRFQKLENRLRLRSPISRTLVSQQIRLR